MQKHEIKCIASEINEEVGDFSQNRESGRGVRELNLVGNNELRRNGRDDEYDEEKPVTRASISTLQTCLIAQVGTTYTLR